MGVGVHLCMKTYHQVGVGDVESIHHFLFEFVETLGREAVVGDEMVVGVGYGDDGVCICVCRSPSYTNNHEQTRTPYCFMALATAFWIRFVTTQCSFNPHALYTQ